MSAVGEVKLRLQETGTPFTTVLGATALALVKEGQRPEGVTLPVCFVLAVKEVTDKNSRVTGRSLQRMERDLMCIYVLEHAGDNTGDAVDDQLEAVKAWSRAKLIGFVPTDMTEKITHVGGEVVEARGGAVWFEDTFDAPTYIREAT